jgi:hypothetical protein
MKTRLFISATYTSATLESAHILCNSHSVASNLEAPSGRERGIVNIYEGSCVFWDTKPCTLLKANRHFEGSCRLLLQRRRKSLSEKPAASYLFPAVPLFSKRFISLFHYPSQKGKNFRKLFIFSLEPPTGCLGCGKSY